MSRMTRFSTLFAAAAVLQSAIVLGGVAATELFLPMVGRKPGIPPSQWDTTVWAYNPNAEAVDVTYFLLERDKANLAPIPFSDVLQPGETKKYEHAIESLFGKEAWGAIRVVAGARVVVSARVYHQLPGTNESESSGQSFAGMPKEVAIGLGESTQVLGVYQTRPAADSEIRYNYGFVEVAGASATLRVTAIDASGFALAEATHNIKPYSQLQYAFKDKFPTLSTTNCRLNVEVTSGNGAVLAYGTGIANGSQDPTTFEMVTESSALGAGAVVHDATLAGDGTEESPLGLADKAVTLPKLGTVNEPAAAAPSAAEVGSGDAASHQFLATDGVELMWADAPAVGDLTPAGITFGAADGALAQDPTQLYWDHVNHRLGLGTAAPSQQLEITGNLQLPLTQPAGLGGVIFLGGHRFLHAYDKHGDGNTFLGIQAGSFVLGEGAPGSGTWNTGVGAYALREVTTGFGNTAVGSYNLDDLHGGSFNTAVGGGALGSLMSGNDNTAVGSGALASAESGMQNTAVGSGSLASNQGSENTAVGAQSLQGSEQGHRNTAVGGFSGLGAGSENACLGYNSGRGGDRNTAVGAYSLGADNQTASENTAVGWSSLAVNSEGYGNTALGVASLQWNRIGIMNTAVGGNALSGSEDFGFGDFNTAVGFNSLGSNRGDSNTAVGTASLQRNTTGSRNTALGRYALAGNDIGLENVAVGDESLRFNLEGGGNTAVGSQSLGANSTGFLNTAVGYHSLRGNSSGQNNIAIGGFALQQSTLGSNNIGIGFGTLEGVQTGDGNVALGPSAGQFAGEVSNRLFIANGQPGSLVYGEFDSRRVMIGQLDADLPTDTLDVNGTLRVRELKAATSTHVCRDANNVLAACSSDARLKTNIVGLSDEIDVIAAVSRLRGVAFEWDRSVEAAREAEPRRQIGLIAQEVEAVLPELVRDEADGYKSLDDSRLVALLVEVAKIQQASIEVQAGRIEELETRLASLERHAPRATRGAGGR